MTTFVFLDLFNVVVQRSMLNNCTHNKEKNNIQQLLFFSFVMVLIKCSTIFKRSFKV